MECTIFSNWSLSKVVSDGGGLENWKNQFVFYLVIFFRGSVWHLDVFSFLFLECNAISFKWQPLRQSYLVFWKLIKPALLKLGKSSFCSLFLGPTRSPKTRLLGCEVLELLDDDCYTVAPLESSATKRKVKFTGILGSPPKIPCANNKSKSVFGTAENWQRFSDTIQLSPNNKVKDFSEKPENLKRKDNSIP